MPFFIGLFYLLQSDLRSDICGRSVGRRSPCAEVARRDHGAEDFLFIPDLTVMATGWVLAVLIVMYISSQLLSSLLTPSTADRNQKMIMYGLPFVFVFFIINFPAGLIVYWITTNLWTVGQGWVLRSGWGPSPPDGRRRGRARGIPAASPSGRGGGFMGACPPPPPRGREERVRAGATRRSRRLVVQARGREGEAASAGSRRRGRSEARRPRRASGEGVRRGGDRRQARPQRPPPPPPRKKKKRSGRRR